MVSVQYEFLQNGRRNVPKATRASTLKHGFMLCNVNNKAVAAYSAVITDENL